MIWSPTKALHFFRDLAFPMEGQIGRSDCNSIGEPWWTGWSHVTSRGCSIWELFKIRDLSICLLLSKTELFSGILGVLNFETPSCGQCNTVQETDAAGAYLIGAQRQDVGLFQFWRDTTDSSGTFYWWSMNQSVKLYFLWFVLHSYSFCSSQVEDLVETCVGCVVTSGWNRWRTRFKFQIRQHFEHFWYFLWGAIALFLLLLQA